ncbi:MAG: serine/threonine-protein kinase [Chloroflexota bacterium]
MSDLIGRKIGSYQITDSIGKGGMATVYKAYQASMDRHVAIKVLPPHFLQDATFVERFEREARTIAKLEHPHILPVYDYGKTDDGLAYIAMRYIETGTLADLLDESVLFLEESIRIIDQVSDALSYAHQQGVVHRDLKPSNILIDLQGQAFLSDFGLARSTSSDGSLTGGMIVGTPNYMAPEQGQGHQADERSDIYALGVILYEMTTGRRPFHAETPMAVMLKHITDPLPPPRQINAELHPTIEQVLLTTLAKEPEERYQTVAKMNAVLKQAIVDISRPLAPVPPSPTPSPMAQTVQRSPAQTTIMASLSSKPNGLAIGVIVFTIILVLAIIFFGFLR